MKKIAFALFALAALSGCSVTSTYRTAGGWRKNADGKPVLYQTYLQATCGYFGCSDEDSHLKRCTLNPDNTMVCVADPEAERMLKKEN